MKRHVFIAFICALFFQPTYTAVNPQPGESIWRLTYAIATTIDSISSVADNIDGSISNDASTNTDDSHNASDTSTT